MPSIPTIHSMWSILYKRTYTHARVLSRRQRSRRPLPPLLLQKRQPMPSLSLSESIKIDDKRKETINSSEEETETRERKREEYRESGCTVCVK